MLGWFDVYDTDTLAKYKALFGADEDPNFSRSQAILYDFVMHSVVLNFFILFALASVGSSWTYVFYSVSDEFDY